MYLKGFSGYASMTPSEPVFTQTLVWAANIPSGDCPPNGSLFNLGNGSVVYPETNNAEVLVYSILKSSDNKPVRVDTNFRLPEKIHLKGCVFVIVGGCGSRTTSLTSESHMSLIYDTVPSNSDATPFLAGITYESVFGWQVLSSQNKCNANLCSADFPQSDRAFARTWKSDGSYQLRYIYGSVSGAGITGLSSINPPVNPPQANWSSDFDYYLYKNCNNMPNMSSGPADFYGQIPADAVALHNIHQEVINHWELSSTDKSFVFGSSADLPVVGDWNSDGKDDAGNYKGNGAWAIDYNANYQWDGTTTDKTFSFGASVDQSVTGDWNGDGITELGNYKGNGTWALDYNGNGVWDGTQVDRLIVFDSATYQPVAGDWNGDGKTEVGSYKSNGTWAIDYNGNGLWDGPVIDRLFVFGSSTDLPVVGDWNGDAKIEIGNYKGNGVWALDYNANGVWDGPITDKLLNFVVLGDIPVTGDWNGDGKTEIGNYNKLVGTWNLDYNGNGTWDQNDSGVSAFQIQVAKNSSILIEPGNCLVGLNRAVSATGGAIDTESQVLAELVPNSYPKGAIDSANCNSVLGWSCDENDYSQSVYVNLYRDGPAGAGGTFVGSVLANDSAGASVRSLCGSYSRHGFSYVVPDSLKDGVSHIFYAYAVNIPSGNMSLLGKISINCTAVTTSSTTTTSTTTTTLLSCVMPGNYPDVNGSCGEVTLVEVVNAINRWSLDELELRNIIDLINSWADPVSYAPA